MLIYIAQLTHRSNGVNQNRSFPLAAGCLAEALAQEFDAQIKVRIFKDPAGLSACVKSEPPDALMLSNYLWNERLSLAFAAKARRNYPDMLIVMGGPNLSNDRVALIGFLKANSFIDKIVLHEGELAAVAIVKKFLETKDRFAVRRERIPSAISLVGDKVIDGIWDTENETADAKPGETGGATLDDIPSPYLSGRFDRFFTDGEHPLIETARGCPFQCAYCQQGRRNNKRVRHYSHERVRAEVMYISRKIRERGVDIKTLSIADSNLAMYERDMDTIGVIREAQDKYGFPMFIICSTGKNKPALVTEAILKLKPDSILYRNSLQSLNEPTLEAIQRSNRVNPFFS